LRDAERRLGAQLSESEKVAAADYVVDNSGSLVKTERQVNKIFKGLQMLAASQPTASHS
jgi:dephospho-CoA kinase